MVADSVLTSCLGIAGDPVDEGTRRSTLRGHDTVLATAGSNARRVRVRRAPPALFCGIVPAQVGIVVHALWWNRQRLEAERRGQRGRWPDQKTERSRARHPTPQTRHPDRYRHRFTCRLQKCRSLPGHHASYRRIETSGSSNLDPRSGRPRGPSRSCPVALPVPSVPAGINQGDEKWPSQAMPGASTQA
jgi:hypothetical protein